MPRSTTTLPQFQEYVWNQLPERQRERAGREMVNDLVAVVVQEWPDDQLSQSSSGGDMEAATLGELRKTVTRHMQLMYGDKEDEKYGFAWVIILQIILPIVINKVLEWWRKRKENQGRIRIWRRKWVNGTEE